MLEIELADGSGRLDLMPGEKISFEESFNLYDFEHVEGKRSWRFKLPKTPNNVRKLGWSAFLESRGGAQRKIAININFNSTLWSSGLLYFQGETSDSWLVYFAGEVGVLKDLIGDKTLLDFNLSSFTGLGNMYDHAKVVAEAGPSSYKYTFAEVYLPKADINPTEVPLPFANYLAYNNTSGLWEGFAGQIGSFYWPLIPFPYVKSVLDEIASELGVSFGGELWENPEFGRLVFFNTRALNSVDEDTGRASGIPVSEVHLSNHVPDIKLVDVLKDLGKFFNQSIKYVDKTQTIQFSHRSKLLSKEVSRSLEQKVVDINQNFGEQRLYSFSSPFSEEDLVACNKVSDVEANLDGIQNGEQSTSVETVFSTLPMRHYGGLLDEITPVSTLNINEEVPKTFMFFSYRRSTRFDGGASPVYDKVPFLRSDTVYTAPPGETKDLNSLKWLSGSGLFNRWWQSYTTALENGKVLTVDLLMDSMDVVNFDESQKQLLFKYHCLFEKIAFNLGGKKTRLKAQVLKL